MLVGSQMPVQHRAPGMARVAWQDGIVTVAAKRGCTLLLDSLGMGTASTLERLNPVLEEAKVWMLAEKGDTDPLQLHPDFRIMATHTVAEEGNNLSPALLNRFSICHMEDAAAGGMPAEDAFIKEMHAICQAVCLDTPCLDAQLAAQVCARIRAALQDVHARPSVAGVPRVMPTRRLFSQLLEFSAAVQAQHGIPFNCALHAAYCMVLQPQLAAWPAFEGQLHAQLQGSLHAPGLPAYEPPGFLPGAKEGDLLGEHLVLTQRRLEAAQAVAASSLCSKGVLLEGPAAVGKTELVKALAHVRGSAFFRVNNSADTSVQDYLGTYLPSSDGGFTYQKGMLLQAMERGGVFLCDEVNLAPAAVLNLLHPLLEGKGAIALPGSMAVVRAAPGFRIFATANNGTYAGRSALPEALRGRLMVVSVPDFSDDELTLIIQRRFKW